MEGVLKRMIRAAKLDSSLYEEVEADKGAMGQAMAVVFLASLAAGVGASATDGLAGLIFGTVSSLVGWYVWAFLTYWVGTRFLPEPQTSADYGELLRTIGFSSAPGVIRVFGVMPGLTLPIFLAASIWMLVAMVVAVRQALDYTGTLRAVAVCAIGWVVQVLVILLLLTLLRGAVGGA